MSLRQIYEQAFIDAFGVQQSVLFGLKYQDVKGWDSLGHMNLIAALEEKFGIEMQIDDITDFSSFERGKEILKKYDIEV